MRWGLYVCVMSRPVNHLELFLITKIWYSSTSESNKKNILRNLLTSVRSLYCTNWLNFQLETVQKKWILSELMKVVSLLHFVLFRLCNFITIVVSVSTSYTFPKKLQYFKWWETFVFSFDPLRTRRWTERGLEGEMYVSDLSLNPRRPLKFRTR